MPNRLVREIIAQRPVPTASVATSVSDAAIIMKENRSSAVMVIRNGILAGIVTERDIVYGVVAEKHDPVKTRVDAVMTRKVQTIDVDKPFGHALHIMYEGGFRHVPVVDEAGRPVGLVAAHDAIGTDSTEFEQELVRREEITLIL